MDKESVVRKFRNTDSDNKRYLVQFYNLDAIISVGFRVNSIRATQFRQWAIKVLRDFATVQDKMHYAIHGHTAAELIINRANHGKRNMGLTIWKNTPDGKIMKSGVNTAKNYLSIDESKSLDRFVGMYLDYAELQAERKIPMAAMEDWAKKLNAFLQFNLMNMEF